MFNLEIQKRLFNKTNLSLKDGLHVALEMTVQQFMLADFNKFSVLWSQSLISLLTMPQS